MWVIPGGRTGSSADPDHMPGPGKWGRAGCLRGMAPSWPGRENGACKPCDLTALLGWGFCPRYPPAWSIFTSAGSSA
jgi:hypothetical protein